jgi:tetratricopeptide (TPR) repeat protein
MRDQLPTDLSYLRNMEFDPENKIIKLCADGMEAEAQGLEDDALNLFTQAWNDSSTDFEKFTSAHFIARHQKTVSEKLKWDEMALEHAGKVNDESINNSYPSLYLNIGKCHEDLNDFELARVYYLKAHAYLEFLPDDGYGKMIKSGIISGIERISK